MDFDVPALTDALNEAGVRSIWRGSGSIAAGRFAAPGLLLPDLGTADNPSVILLRTADTPERISGWEVGYAWGDEVTRWKEDRVNPKRDPFVQLVGRVRHSKARLRQIVCTFTHEGNTTRAFDEFAQQSDDRALYVAPTWENPSMGAFLEGLKKSLTQELYHQYAGGVAIDTKGGRLYPAFDAALHVDAGVALRPGLPLHVAFDFNIAPGMHVEVGQYWPEADLYAVAWEIHGQGMDVGGAVAALVKLLSDLGGWSANRWGDALHVFGDASGDGRWAGTGQSCYDILGESLAHNGIPFRRRVPAANPPIRDRVNAFNCAMVGIDGGVHWKCHPRCVRLIEDLRTMRWKDGEPDKSDTKRSHASEAEGYRIHYLRPIRKPRPAAGGRVVLGGPVG
jgi:hypothetical protein